MSVSLSSQDHYDWGLRAIKSVLVVAGSLKRGDPHRPEDQVLMRALRDFNVPKIVTDDMPVFMGLIGDLFPALDVPRKRDMDFEKFVKQSVLDLKLQPEDNFVLKVSSGDTCQLNWVRPQQSYHKLKLANPYGVFNSRLTKEHYTCRSIFAFHFHCFVIEVKSYGNVLICDRTTHTHFNAEAIFGKAPEQNLTGTSTFVTLTLNLNLVKHVAF